MEGYVYEHVQHAREHTCEVLSGSQFTSCLTSLTQLALVRLTTKDCSMTDYHLSDVSLETTFDVTPLTAVRFLLMSFEDEGLGSSDTTRVRNERIARKRTR